MPLVRVEILKGNAPEYKKAILDGIHSALVKAFQTPDHDRHQRLYELESEEFEIPAPKTRQFTLIELTVFQGRSLQAKRELYSEITKNLGQSPGIKGDDILIVLHEPSLDNWGIRGGKPASEVDLGFKVDV